MKKSKLFKLLKEYSDIKTPIREKIDYADYNGEVSKKLYDLILNIMKYKDSMNISFSDTSISISVPDIKNIKNNIVNNKNQVVPYSDDYYLEVNIVKDEGFSISYSYKKRSYYSDKEMYNQLINIVSDRLKEINSDNFNEIWESVMKESGFIREDNLEKLFNE
jgi:hypothetical protein